MRRNRTRWLIAAVIVYKTREYAAGNAFYDSLRGMR